MQGRGGERTDLSVKSSIALLVLALLVASVASAQTRVEPVRWTDPNGDAMFGVRTQRRVEMLCLPQHHSWWTVCDGRSPLQTTGTPATIYSWSPTRTDWPGCEDIAIRFQQQDTGLWSAISATRQSAEPCIVPPPERITVVPEPPIEVLSYTALVTLAALARRRGGRGASPAT